MIVVDFEDDKNISTFAIIDNNDIFEILNKEISFIFINLNHNIYNNIVNFFNIFIFFSVLQFTSKLIFIAIRTNQKFRKTLVFNFTLVNHVETV